MTLTIYPAIDLRGGRCVRLRQGNAADETLFAADPVDAARRWAGEGAEWLHVVNLDGALGQSGAENLRALERILTAAKLRVQFGGGLRSLVDIARLVDLGVARIILGTVAVQRPQVVEEALLRWGPERVSVGIDARGGLVVIHGWLDTAQSEAVGLAVRMRSLGITRVVYTDVGRDGMLSGVNLEATTQLARASGLRVIASGGVSSLADIRLLREHETDGIEGVIIGMALYRGNVRLAEALQLTRGG
jgi:phosphoribosylformimino-5-aminoimidazole carboxamide ribotide isomerase